MLNGGPFDLLLAVMVLFDKYCHPTLHDSTVPITLIICRTWLSSVVTAVTLTGMGCNHTHMSKNYNPEQGITKDDSNMPITLS